MERKNVRWIECPVHGRTESYLKDSVLFRYACKDCWEDENRPLGYLDELVLLEIEDINEVSD